MGRTRTPVGRWGDVTVKPDGKKYMAYAYYRDYDGVLRRVNRWGKTKGLAQRALGDALHSRSKGFEDIKPETPLRDVSEAWIAEREASDLEYLTVKRDREIIKVVNAAFGDLAVREATSARLHRGITAIAERNGRTTAKKARQVLSGMMGLAVRNDAIPANPVDGVPAVKVESAAIRALTPEDFARFRETIHAAIQPTGTAGRRRDPILLDVVDGLIATGCRPGEVLAMQPEDVGPDFSTVEITGNIYRESGVGLKIKPSTKTGDDRWLVLPMFAREMFSRRLAVLGKDAPSIFPSAAGTLMDPDNFRKQWRRAVMESGFEWVTPKILRKSVATLLANELDSTAAADQLGHIDDKITKAHYIEKARVLVDNSELLSRFSKPPENLQQVI